MQKEVLVLSALMLVGGLVSCRGNQQQDKKGKETRNDNRIR